MSDHGTILFRLDPRTGVPPYRQLVDQVRAAVADGRLRVGDQLPSVREVVGQVTINPNTVHRAYRELEYLGVVEGRSGLGTFVREGVVNDEDPAWGAQLEGWLRRARDHGLDDADLELLWRRALDRSRVAR